MTTKWTNQQPLHVKSTARNGAIRAIIVVGSMALLGGIANVGAAPLDVAAAHAECVKQAQAGTRHPSAHAKNMGAACDALAGQAGQAARAQTVPALVSTCRDEASKGHPAGASPYKRQFRDMHKIRSRAACGKLADAVLAGAGRAP